MIAVTGAAGFIGANVVAELNRRGYGDIVAVDFFAPPGPSHDMKNDPAWLDELDVTERVEVAEFPAWLEANSDRVESIVHMGACSDTTQSDEEFITANNFEYTRTLWNWATANQRPFVYASSAATYGDGDAGYDDQCDPSVYQPLNLYGWSKHNFDLWALEQTATPPRWAGMKFFNVYGPRESHKGRMASVVFHAFNQIRETGQVRLFESHRDDYSHGGQMRDFVYVEDVVNMTLHMLFHAASETAPNGVFNAGSGTARPFQALAEATFAAMGLEPNISYFPMPEDLRGKYQYFTEAKMDKIESAGYTIARHSLESGVTEYVNWLSKQ
ncbi:MAG: ADP-glyceromanno-heptose 6-epimerase [Phycisphaerales bacterium]|jgi:ADP-L-glycero-D-manno-heptose 6-epimerase|nr:ADP-glyceromanno-heptose 6-epimerase [Phycisphaerales bacterium]